MFLAFVVASVGIAAGPPAGLTAPPGFTVTRFAGPDLATDIYCLHVDAAGRVHVAGRGYARELRDAAGGGTADSSINLVTGLADGPMGMLREGDTLYLVADGGLKRYDLTPGKPTPAAAGKLLVKLKTAGEHDAHAVRRGPDGNLYVMCGNMAGVPKAVAGCMLRIADGGKAKIVADGFRNAYDFAFGPAGDIYTFDSDNERCLGLPWYEPTRVYRVVPGGHYGWLSPQFTTTWRLPSYLPDVVAPICMAGRGSPTGVACDRGGVLPGKYRGGLFLADWTFGRILFVDPRRPGPPEVFLSATGDAGFAPTGLAISPTGDVFISSGGRGSKGSVYRVTPPSGGGPKGVPAAAPQARPAAHGDLVAARAAQLELGDIGDPKANGTGFEGYTPRKPIPPTAGDAAAAAARGRLPCEDGNARRELLRILAMTADPHPDAVAKCLETVTPTSTAADDIHALLTLARLPAARMPAQTAATAAGLLNLDAKAAREKLTRDRYWPVRIAEAAAGIAKHDPGLAAALAATPGFGRAEQVVFAGVPKLDRDRFATAVLLAAAADPEYAWQADHLKLLAALPAAQVRPWLDRLWDRGGLEDEVVILLAKSATPADRPKLLAGLRSFRPAAVGAAANAVGKLPGKPTTDEVVGLVRALKTLDEKDRDPREKVAAALAARTGDTAPPTYAGWLAWATANAPEAAAVLNTRPGGAAAARKRFDAVDWAKGDAANGLKVFAKAQCAACHNAGRAVGPSLDGVTGRFGRDDLLTAIIDPDRDVSPRYRATRVNTHDGTDVTGVIIYEAVDGIMLVTAAGDAVRVAGDRVAGKKTLENSLMPAGLLDPFAPADVADLFAYLKTLAPPKP